MGLLRYYSILRLDWSTKHGPLSQPIRCKIESKDDLVARVFPRLRWFACFYFKFSLAPRNLLPSSDWPLWLLPFLFLRNNQKALLSWKWYVLFPFLDEDECSTGSHQCTGGSQCINNQGSYTCQCASGLKWNANELKCQGKHSSFRHLYHIFYF